MPWRSRPAPALGDRPPGVPVADRVPERRGEARVQAAARDTAGNPAAAGSADHVAIASHDLCHRTVAGDNTSVSALRGAARLRSRALVPGSGTGRHRYRAAVGSRAMTRGRGPRLEASADSGEGLAVLAWAKKSPLHRRQACPAPSSSRHFQRFRPSRQWGKVVAARPTTTAVAEEGHTGGGCT
jgi:hypothetical protein